MFQKYFISAYASSRTLSTWDEAVETFLFHGLAESPHVKGIEVPIILEGEAYPLEWLCKTLPKHWQLHLTTLPAVMTMAQQYPHAGLASKNEEERQRTLALIKKTYRYAEELAQRVGRPVVSAVTLYSSPQQNLEIPCSSKEALQRSLAALGEMEWGSIALNLEHCDAFTHEHPADKGFLSLEEEMEVLQQVGGIGLLINWARSAIETRSPEGPLQHLRQALSHQLLRGAVFSGCTSSATNPYGSWKDSHMPPRGLKSDEATLKESLLGEEEIAALFNLIADRDLFLGIKISNRLVPFDIQRSLAWVLETIALLERAIKK
ncbi:MAG: DUF4862 family protein [Chthoniobacterales bacterium]|nr:DUF4862 family protein [Chthoniobacterales bacterium]